MNFISRTIIALGSTFLPVFAHAYVGPGAGLSAIGTILAFIGAILLLVIGFLWYPIKRLLNRNKSETEIDDEESSAGTPKNGSDSAGNP